MLKPKLQYFGHLMWRTDSLEKTLMMGKIEGRRGRGQQRMRWLDGITNLIDIEFEKTPGVGDGLGSLACCSPWGCKESDTTEWLNWACFFKPGSNQNDCCPPAKDWESMWTNLDWSVLCKEGKMPQGRNEGGISMKCGFLGFCLDLSKARTILRLSWFFTWKQKKQQERGMFGHFCGLEMFLFLSLRQHYRLDLFLSCSIIVTEWGDSFACSIIVTEWGDSFVL